MNVLNNFSTKPRYSVLEKKSKSINRANIERGHLPSLKVAINKEINFKKNPYLEIINQNKKKNHSQVNYPQKNHKPFSGNPLKFHMKKELNNINSIKYYPEREIFTANPYVIGHNPKKKNVYKKNNNNIMNINELLINKRLIYPNYNNINKNNHPMNYKKPPLLNSEDKSNNVNKEMKLRAVKPNINSTNKIVIIANDNNTLNNSINNIKSEDMRKTMTSNKSNQETLANEKQHIDLCFISYAYNEYPNLEHRKEMEDFHYIKALLFKKNSCSYFGLFDGHSGKEVGIYLMENLHKILLKNFKEKNDLENSNNINNISNIVINSFEQIDKEINSLNYKNETGSTGTVLLLFKDENSPSGKSLLCANVGDSKAYLITKTEMKLITKDHKCNDPNEVQRIRDNGGVVFRERVFGTLMLTRSFGDKEMKKYGVLSTPDIYFKNVEKDDIFVVISSDGIWDVVEENEIFEMAQKGISSSDLSKKIVNLAKERETHIVVKLNKSN